MTTNGFAYILFIAIVVLYIKFLIDEHKDNKKRLKYLSELPDPLPYYYKVTTTKKILTKKRIIRPLRKRKKIL